MIGDACSPRPAFPRDAIHRFPKTEGCMGDSGRDVSA